MDIDYSSIIVGSIPAMVDIAAKSFSAAFEANPPLFLGAGAILAISALIPTRRTRRRRRA